MPKRIDLTNPRRRAAYARKLKKRAFAVVGESCVWCGAAEDLEMAHVRPTELSGTNGRGLKHRYLDALKHPECYAAMCRRHHRLFDRYLHDLMEMARDGVVPDEEPIPF